MGREPLEHLDEIPAHQHWTVRCLQSLPGNARADVVGARGPFTLEGERELFTRLGTDVLVSKNSGSQATEPKLQVARERGVPVLILARPELPGVDRECDNVEAMWTMLESWLQE
jgi:precorrin-6A/cobalt-precorrin-6A reductase